jgi:DnaJ-domain-containing protein 1
MFIPTLDRSNYLKGLVILARQDKRLVDNERDVIRDVAQRFGFSRDFYEDVLRNLMANKYIKDDPFRFSSREIAESFLTDGFKLALSDNSFDNTELVWLKSVAAMNEIPEDKFRELLNDYLQILEKTKSPADNSHIS